MRKFYLQNQDGDRWKLQGEKGAYLTDPTGLGITMSQTYADLQKGFFRAVSSDNEPQSNINCTITFIRPAYRNFRSFVNWFSAATALQLIYIPYGTEEYHRHVDITSFMKSELDENQFLSCELAMVARSPWFKATATHFELATQTEDKSMRYTMTYNTKLLYGEDATSALTGTIPNAGHVPASVFIVFRGGGASPVISLTGQLTGKLYGACRIDDTVAASETLYFSTDYLDSYCYKVSAAGEQTDLLSKIDLSGEPFFRVPLTEPCTLSISANSAISGSADVTVNYYFRSV